MKSFFRSILLIVSLLLVPTVSASANEITQAQESSVRINVTKTLSTIAFGDSNSQNFRGGISNWYEQLQAKTIANTITLQFGNQSITYNFTFNNQSNGGVSMSPTMLGDRNAQYNIGAVLGSIPSAQIGFVMLGTNDAYRGGPVDQFIASYRNFITLIKKSRKVGSLVILAVPAMTPPYNCPSRCFPFVNNPQVDMVIPYNQKLSRISYFCASIGFRCVFIDSAANMPTDSNYIDNSNGIHLLNPAQKMIASKAYDYLRQVSALLS